MDLKDLQKTIGHQKDKPCNCGKILYQDSLGDEWCEVCGYLNNEELIKFLEYIDKEKTK